VALFDGVEAEPSLDTVRRGIEAALSHEADAVVAIGGGSTLDVGKAVAAVARAHGGLDDSTQAARSLALHYHSGRADHVRHRGRGHPERVLTDRRTRVKASVRGAGLMPESRSLIRS